ncbi:MAG: hypothetical protein E7576_05570 [Ruminococcaceae bacterium]|nr:hypothetical protein [Oscillospiraceae bacterium]
MNKDLAMKKKALVSLLVGLLAAFVLFPILSARVFAAGGTDFTPTKRDADGRLIGDVNGDNSVDAEDRLILARFLAGWEDFAVWFKEEENTPAGGAITLRQGESRQIEYSGTAVAGWFATDSSVATVSNSGLITAQQPGTTIVRAYDSTSNTIGGMYTVQVSADDTAEYTVSYYSGPTKKAYSVGDKLDTAGLYLVVRDKNNNQVATLSGAALLVWPYVFKDADITTGTKTTTITVDVNYQHKLYSVAIPGFTVTPAKPTLNVRTTAGNRIYSMTVELKKDRYPIGSALSLADIDRIYGLDVNSEPFTLTPDDLSHYANTFSLEVVAVNSRGETSRKVLSSTRSIITADDVFTASGGGKYAYLRFYIDDYYTEFAVLCCDTGFLVNPYVDGNEIRFTAKKDGQVFLYYTTGNDPVTSEEFYAEYKKAAYRNSVSVNSGISASITIDSGALTLNRYTVLAFLPEDSAINSRDYLAPIILDLGTVETPATVLKITKQPQDYAMKSTSDKPVFSVTVSGGKAPYTYSWYIDTDYYRGTGPSRTKNETSDQYVEDDPYSLASQGDYIWVWCKITDANGTTVESAQANLYRYYAAGAELKITKQPDSYWVVEGQNVTFTVEVDGGTKPYKYDWQWRDYKTDWNSYTEQGEFGSPTKQIKNVQDWHLYHNEQYQVRCVITDAKNRKVITNAVTMDNK